MNVHYLTAAEAEFEEAIDYYNKQGRDWALSFQTKSKTRSRASEITRSPGHGYRSVLGAARFIAFPTV